MSAIGAFAIIWRALTPAQRRRFVFLQFVAVFMALSTVMGLAAVMTFLAVLAQPTLIETHPALNRLWHLGGMAQRDFLVGLGAGFIVLLFMSAFVNVFGTRAMVRYAQAVGDRIRELLFAGYLRRAYMFHAHVGAGRLMENVSNQTDRVVFTLLNGQQLMTNAVLTLFVVVSIAIVNFKVALAGVFGVAGSYFFIYRVIRWRIARHGRVQTQLSAERIALIQQAFLGIKYLQVARAQPFFDRRFAAVTRALSHTLSDTQFIALFPKYVLECLAGAALIGCAALVSGNSASAAWLAQLSFIGFAGLRLLPAFQQMYNAVVIVRNNRPAIENVASQLADNRGYLLEPQHATDAQLQFRRLEMAGVSFRYSPTTPLVLDSATLRIPAGAAIGIVGASGCGKTTLVDLILGLLSPVGGRIEIDGEALGPRRLMAWQRSIGYVPQEVLMLDASVRENIAFGLDPAQIDDAQVRDAAIQAGASEFIEALPGGFTARLSGAGGGLSGGQRQRIGIARALYCKPSLLILDEATNSLDADTERALIDAVVRNRGARTLVIVAHGAAVIDACDRVYELRNGKLLERGSPQARERAQHARRAAE